MIVVVLILLLLLLLFLLIKINIEIKKVNYFLTKNINGYSKTNLKSTTENREINFLISNINQLIKKYNYMEKHFNNDKEEYQKLITAIAHDFKTPVTTIMGYIDLSLLEKDSEKREKHLKIVKKRVEELNILIDNFFVLSALNVEKYPYELSEVNISKVLNAQLLSYYDEIEKVFSNIEIDVADNLIISDEKALIRIFNNIIKNAIKYGREEFVVITNNSDEEYTIIFKNKINLSKSKKESNSLGIGLQIIEKIANDLKIRLLVKQNEEEYVLKLEFKKGK